MVKAEDIESLAKRRGIFWPTAEIYGGLAGFWDYGPIGTKIKRKLENLWREYFLNIRPNIWEIETTNILPEKVLVASGHVEHFLDPVAKCKKCGTFHRADHILEEFLHESFEGKTPEELTEIIKKHNVRCPKCGGPLEEVKPLNLMFSFNVGAEDNKTRVYLRPETAQGAYINFQRCWNSLRKKFPLGLAIIGRAYRNEISPRQMLMRVREFTQAELQLFFDPEKVDECEDWEKIKDYELIVSEVGKKTKKIKAEELAKRLPKFYIWNMVKIQEFYLKLLKIPEDRFRFRELSEEEKSFYNKYHWDHEIKLESYDWKEVGGLHYRTDHDLKGHQKYSGKSQEVFIDGKRFIPHVMELTFGIDRLIFALLDVNYKVRDGKVILTLPKKISPIEVAIFPLVKKDGLPEKSEEILKDLSGCFEILYDKSDSIGKRYARVDEIGIPYAVTIDHQTLEDDTVTVRDRDTAKQERIKISDLKNYLWGKLK